jgi:hypothetical protein
VLRQEYKRKRIGEHCKDLCNGGGENGFWTGRLNQMMYRQDKTWRRGRRLGFCFKERLIRNSPAHLLSFLLLRSTLEYLTRLCLPSLAYLFLYSIMSAMSVPPPQTQSREMFLVKSTSIIKIAYSSLSRSLSGNLKSSLDQSPTLGHHAHQNVSAP